MGDKRGLEVVKYEPPGATSEAACDICRALSFGATRAAFACVQCHKRLCRACTAKHSGDPLLARHTVLRLAEGLDLTCKRHPQETLQQFCVTCHEPICVVCALALHDNHHRQGLARYMEAQRQHVDMLAEEADLKARCGMEVRAQVHEALAALEGDMEQARQAVDAHHHTLLTALGRKRDLLHKQLQHIYNAKREGMMTCGDEVDRRLGRLGEFTEAARALSDARLLRLSPHFIANFSAALDVEPDDLDEAEQHAHLYFIPSYDINIGTFGDQVSLDVTAIQRGDSVFKDDFETTTASLWDTTAESSSLGFHDDHWATSIGGDFEPLHSSSVGQWEGYVPSTPSRPVSSSQSSTNFNVNDENTKCMSFGQISQVREIKPQSLQDPKLIFTIDYTGVISQCPTGIETYPTAPIDVEFKNEHKLFVTQWGVDTRESKGTADVRYRQAKVGMVLYSMCCDQPAVVTSFENCSPWCVTSSGGEVLVSDLRNTSRTLRKYRADGALNESWTEHIVNTPRGVATHGDRVIVTDTHHRNVYVVDQNKDGFAQRINSIGAVAKLRRFRSESNLSATAVSYSDTQFINPLFAACNSVGLILVSDAGDNVIKFYDQGGECMGRITEARPGDPLDTPMGLCVDSIDNVYVCDYGNDRVLKFNRHGHLLAEVLSATKGGVHRPRGVDVYAGFLAVSCHSRLCEPQVKVFELAQQLARQPEPPCECQWLRLCAAQDE